VNDAIPTTKGTRVSALINDNGTVLVPGLVLNLVLQRWVVTFRVFESFAVVAGFRFGLPAAAPARPVQHVVRGRRDGQDELAEQAADLVAAQLDQRVLAVAGSPFAASWARVATRNAAAVMARVMWAYQAS
jgi:hypothetical protein